MEVTTENFQEVLTELDEVLKNASFLAIDGEFTGLNSGPDAKAFDTPAQYYDKLRAGSMNFLLVQFGLSVFTHQKDKNTYSQRSYNFYVFPRPFDRTSPDCRFLCQASSISFLVNQGFDFNKLFKLGIPYLTQVEEDKLNKKLEEKQKMKEDGYDLIPIPDDDKIQIEDICTKLEEFLNSEEDCYVLDRYNAFIRRLIYQEVRLRWPDIIRLEGKNENGNQYLIAYKTGSREEEEQKEAERRQKEKQDVQQAVGLSALLRKISESGKIIVGHNMLLDLCHIIHQFFGPLPESYSEFKSLVHCLFPKLLDTKIICQSAQFKDAVPSVLNQLLEILKHPPYVLPETENIKGRSYSLLENKAHEAGYDAYITGLCFIALCERLGSFQIPPATTVLADSPLLYPYLNKLLIARLKDYPYIHLTGKDPNPSRDHVFHITFPKEWKLSDISQVFSPYGGAYVSWLSDTTAYAALYKRDQTTAVIKNLFKSSQFSLKKYIEHQAILEKNKPDKLERKRKISDSSSDNLAKESTLGEDKKENGSSTKKGNSSTTKVTSDNKEEDNGWEVASGNCEKLQVNSNTNNNKRIQQKNRVIKEEEQFNVVRKVRLKNNNQQNTIKPSTNNSATPSYLVSSTRYTILRDLDDYHSNNERLGPNEDSGAAEEAEVEEELLVKRERVVEIRSRSRVSPKKYSKVSPRKNKDDNNSWRRRNFICNGKDNNGKRTRKNKKVSKYWALYVAVKITILLLLFYFLLFHRGKLFDSVILDELSLTH